jgi:hypothetical protein
MLTLKCRELGGVSLFVIEILSPGDNTSLEDNVEDDGGASASTASIGIKEVKNDKISKELISRYVNDGVFLFISKFLKCILFIIIVIIIIFIC